MENLFWDNDTLLYDIKLSKLDIFAINMIQKNPNMDCVLPAYYSKNKNKVFFTTDEMVTLSSIIEDTIESDIILNILIQICDTINMTKINMLNENNLIFDTEYILFDNDTKSIKMTYIPIENNSNNINIRNFFKELILEVETDNYSLNSTLFKKINKKNFELNEFLDFLKNYQKEISISKVKSTYEETPIYEENTHNENQKDTENNSSINNDDINTIMQEIQLNVETNENEPLEIELDNFEENHQFVEEIPLNVDTISKESMFNLNAVNNDMFTEEDIYTEHIDDNNMISNKENDLNTYNKDKIDETPNTLEDILNSNKFHDDQLSTENNHQEKFSINQEEYEQYDNFSNFEYLQDIFNNNNDNSNINSNNDISKTSTENVIEDITFNTNDANNLNNNIDNINIPVPKIAKIVRTKDNSTMIINKKYFIIGKSKATDFAILDNKTISRSHATIIHQDDNYYISDNGSINGTWVNNNKVEKLEKIKLNNNDIITLSSKDETFIFYLE